MELDALIAAGTVALSPAQRSLLSRLPVESFDWDLFLRLARDHRLAGIVNRHIRCGVLNQVPDNVAQDFANCSNQQGRYNLWLTAALLELLTAFKDAGIIAIPYKGPVLTERLYGSLELRASSDLDIIVRPQDLGRARDCLVALGFEDSYGLDRTRQDAAFRFGFEHSFNRSGLKIDLHWRIAAHWFAPSLDMEAVFRRATPKPFLATECLCLSDEDTIVALCLHAAQHDWGHISQFVDLIEMLRVAPGLRWELIRSQMSDPQMERILLVSFQIVDANWDVELPSWFGEAIQRRPAMKDLAALARHSWTLSSWNSPFRWGLIKRMSGETLSGCINFIFGVVFEPKVDDLRAFHLPPCLCWLYWFLRPLRLVWKRLPGIRIHRTGSV